MNFRLNIAPLEGRELADYGAVRIRDQAFDALQKLLRRRLDEGETQKDIADRIGMDAGQLSKLFRGPGNWTLRTIGALVQALRGEAELYIAALEDPVETPGNFDAYDEYRQISGPVDGLVWIIPIDASAAARTDISQGRTAYEIKMPASEVASITVGAS